MGDFAGGCLKYLRAHPVRRLSLAGGFAKLSKLAQGHLDLHSGASQIDQAFLAAALARLGASEAVIEGAGQANSANQVLAQSQEAGLPLGDHIAGQARATALATLAGETAVEVLIFNREGEVVGRAGFA